MAESLPFPFDKDGNLTRALTPEEEATPDLLLAYASAAATHNTSLVNVASALAHGLVQSRGFSPVSGDPQPHRGSAALTNLDYEQPDPAGPIHGGVYLAGGLHSNWQDTVIARFPGIPFADPRVANPPGDHPRGRELFYTAWDLAAIRRSRLLFAYLEASNPTAYGLALECGYAHALGIPIILVDEKSVGDPVLRRRLGMVHSIADWRADTLEAGLAWLEIALNMLRRDGTFNYPTPAQP